MNEMTLNEKKETVINSYKQTFDKGVSYKKCDLSSEEIVILDKDKDFQSRLNFFLAEAQEKLINRLDRLSQHAEKDEVALKATIKLGEIIYPEAFITNADDGKTELVLPLETQKKLKDIFSSGTLDAWKKQVKEKLLTIEEDPEEIINNVIN